MHDRGEGRAAERWARAVRLFVGRTPFYAESGGQIGDCGELQLGQVAGRK